MLQKIKEFYRDSDLWYMFIYKLSVRRHFIPIISVFFLTLPNTSLHQIGIFTACGFLAGMILEVPSGYISDTIGHKKALYLSRFSMIISLLFFIAGGSILTDVSFYLFIAGSVFLSIGFAFNSGSLQAYFYEILEMRGQKCDYTRINARMSGTVSLVAVIFLVLLPLSMKIYILLPFILNIIFDIIGIVALLKLPDPRDSKKIIQGEQQTFLTVCSKSIQLGFFPFALFLGFISGMLHGKHAFDTVYLEQLGLPIIFIGALMGLSRLFRFVLSRKIHVLDELLTMKQLFMGEIILYTFGLITVAVWSNFSVVLIVLAFMTGFSHAVGSIHTKYSYEKYLHNPKYKATLSSLKQQVSLLLSIVFSFSIGFILEKHDFQFVYFSLACILFLVLGGSYYFLFRNSKNGSE